MGRKRYAHGRASARAVRRPRSGWNGDSNVCGMATTPIQSSDGARLYDVDQVRRDAKASILKGPVTADYPLDLKRTYQLMNEALAAEILCVLRYRHHQIHA